MTAVLHRLGCVFGVILGVPTLIALAGSWHWRFDLFTHFRVQYLAGLALVTGGLLVLRCWRSAGLFAVLATVNLVAVAPLYLGATVPPAGGAAPLRVMLSNVNLRRGDPERIAAAVEDLDPDVLVLAEIDRRWVRALEPALARFPAVELHPRTDCFGIGIASRYPLRRTEVVTIGDVPSIVAEIETPDGPCTVIAAHPVPPRSERHSTMRNATLRALARIARDATSPVVLVGDLNATPWCAPFEALLEDGGLRDSAAGRGVQPTWPTDVVLLRIPIDHCLLDPAITVVDRFVGPNVGSDHFPLVVDLALPGTTRPAR